MPEALADGWDSLVPWGRNHLQGPKERLNVPNRLLLYPESPHRLGIQKLIHIW